MSKPRINFYMEYARTETQRNYELLVHPGQRPKPAVLSPRSHPDHDLPPNKERIKSDVTWCPTQWWTYYSSSSAVRAATVMAKMLIGRNRLCWLRRLWTQESGACLLPGCGQVPGDVTHLLSGECPALQPYLATPTSSTMFSLSCMETGMQ